MILRTAGLLEMGLNRAAESCEPLSKRLLELIFQVKASWIDGVTD